MKQTIINNASRVYYFSFCLLGRVITITVPPGSMSTQGTYIPELRKLKTFNQLEKDGVIVVAGQKPVKEKPVVEEKPKKIKAKKSKSTKMDLESL